MSYEHELDQQRDHQHDAPSADSDQAAPGRASKSAQLRRAESPVPSGIIMRKASGAVGEDPEQAVAKASASSGGLIPDDLRAKFESSLGVDLSDVRVHTGAESAEAAGAVGAHAYALGSDIHFADGQYDPHSEQGQLLLAHEVAHTVQQRGAPAARQNKLAVSSAGDAAEGEADRAASAMITGAPATVSASGITIARKEAPAGGGQPSGESKPTGEAKPLTADDKARLANAVQLLNKARTNIQTAHSALSNYVQQSSGLLSQIKADFDAVHTKYEVQFERVNDIIGKAKRVYAVQMTVVDALIDQALGPAGKAVKGAFGKVQKLKQTSDIAADALTNAMAGASALDALKTVKAAGAEASGGLTAQVETAVVHEGKKAAGMKTEVSGPGSSGSDENAFLASYGQLQGAAQGLLPLAMKVGALGAPFAAAHTLVTVMQQDNKSRPDKTPQGVETDAANVWNGSAGLAGIQPAASSALAALQDAASAGTRSKPKNDMEIQKEIWVKWAANLPSDGGTDALDLGVIEDHLRAIGIWDQLGIDVGDWMSDKDEAIAVCSAKAQEMVLAHKGEVVEVYVDAMRTEIPGLGYMPCTFENLPAAKRVRATVVSARANGTLDHSILDQGSRDRNVIAKALIESGKVVVVLRHLENVAD